MDWSKVEKQHVEAAIKKFIEEKPDHPEPRSYYLMYEGEKLPSKYIRGLAYSIATGEELTLSGFSGGVETVNFFKKYGYTVEQLTDEADDKYSVNEAVWIATALMAAEQYSKNPNANREDMFFKQSEIVKRAQSLIKSKVDSARVSWWVNADNEKHTQNYLRADSLTDPSSRRLSMMDEFPDKSYPNGLDMSDELEMNGLQMTMEELFFFVKEQYPEVINTMQTVDIDYLGVLDYLENNQEIPYSNPEAPGVDPDEKTRLLGVKQKGQTAVAEMKKMASRCADLYGLDKCLPISWLDGSNTKTRKYLWAQMKYKDYSSNPVSISLFVEKNNGVTRYRISLEIKNDGTDKATMAKYHSHLDMPIEAGMVYVSGSNEWGNPAVITDTADAIKAKIESGEIRKVQLCIYIEPAADKTNEQFDAEVMTAVKKLIPYYEHVIGKVTTEVEQKDEYWPSYEEYPVDLTKEDWKRFLEDVEVPKHRGCMRVLKCFIEIGGIASCKQLSDAYGGHPTTYTSSVYNTSRRALQFFNMEPCPDGEVSRYFSIAFQGHSGNDESNGTYIYKMRDELKEALQEMDLEGVETKYKKEGVENNSSFDKNMILYGPPGTGKTYSTAIYAVAICDGINIDKVRTMDYAEVMARYRDLTSAGRIAFTTFHQSYGYEEFIEGIKPVVNEEETSLGYTIEPGVFKKFCEKAGIPEQKDIQFTGTVWNIRSRANDSDVKFDYENYLYSEGAVVVEDIEDYKRQCNFLTNMAQGDLVVLGRDFQIKAVGIVTDDTPEKIDKEPFYWQRKVEWLAKGLSLTFSDIGMPGGCVSNFAVAKSKIKVQNLASILSQNEEPKPHVFVIDEINRGNISKIFGELITLIEDTKRGGMDEEASAILPYSNDPFSVPSNVYILGTMNTADRSIALMDTALRRRFQFIEMMPDADVLRAIGADKVEDLDVAVMLEKINERITFLYDREHTIGHAFFTKLANSPDIETLQSIFEKSVIPLLQEYFYEDYQKIQLVLGDNGKTDPKTKFILDEEVKVKSIFKGNADDVVDLPEKKYSINKEAFANLESYKQII